MELRLDGYFYAKAEAEEAQMTTHPIKAKNAMHLNAVIHDAGYIDITLLDKNDRQIPGYHCRLDSGDSVGFEIFPRLPKEEFKVKLQLRNADVYTLNF